MLIRSARRAAKRLKRAVKNAASGQADNYAQLRTLPRYQETKALLLGRPIIMPDGPSFYYSHREIFTQEIYSFDCDHDSPRIIDCGSNIGLSVIYFKTRFPKARITAVEPDPHIRNYLVANIESFELSDIDLREQAVSMSSEPVSFAPEGADAGRIVQVTCPQCSYQVLC